MDRDRPAHGVHNVLGDGHAQPGPLRFPDPGVVLPAEGLKDDLLILLGHPDARVPHQEVGADPGGVLRQGLLVHSQLHRALLRGEFDGVPQQVQQHLVQPHAVAAHVFREDLPEGYAEPLVLRRGLGLYDADDAVHRLLQRHRLQVQQHFAAFNLGYVQHVVDQPQQVLAGQGDLPQVVPHLLRVVRIVQGQGGHAHDGVHGRADIVAHAGQKLLLCPVGLLRLPPGLLGGSPGGVHLPVHPLQLGHLPPEQLQIPEEQVEQHGDHRAGGGVNQGEPAAPHARDGVVQPLEGEHRHQIPVAVGQVGAVDVPAGPAVSHHRGIVLPGVHGGLQLLHAVVPVQVLPVKEVSQPVEIVLVGVALVPHHIAAVLPDHKGIAQRLVGVQKQHLAHVLGGQAHHNRQAVPAAGHGIRTGDGEQNHAVPAAVHGGGRLALPLLQALQKGLRVVELHGIAEDHLKPALRRVQGGAQEMPGPRAVLDLLPGAVGGGPISRRDVGDGLRHGQPELNDRLKVQGHLLVHPGHVGGADLLNRGFAHAVNGRAQQGKHENRQTNHYHYADF